MRYTDFFLFRRRLIQMISSSTLDPDTSYDLVRRESLIELVLPIQQAQGTERTTFPLSDHRSE